jgi:putative NIF3 family GTP cyclohydrolase 1 type 2
VKTLNRTNLLFGLVLAMPLLGQKQAVTARQIVARIEQHLGVQTPAKTVDTFKAGDPDTPVTGIAVTMMATYDVLERASAMGDNLVITHEPTFYNHLDDTDTFRKQDDPVWAQKEKFIADHHMVVWRFHDGWHLHQPDGILLGMTRALGWENFEDKTQNHIFVLPEMTVRDLANEIDRKLDIRVMRVVGDPAMKVSRVAFLPGAAGSAKQIQLLERPEVEVLLIGEVPEWETVEYAADAVSEGKQKVLLILGHVKSEQEGMAECTRWLRSFISEVPVGFVFTKEPYWSVGAQAGK